MHVTVRLTLLLLLLLLTACGIETGGGGGLPSDAPHLVIWSGSENKFVQKKIEAWGNQHGVRVDFEKHGSVDCAREAAKQDGKCNIIWPASSLQVQLAKRWGAKVKHAKSVFFSYVVLAAPERVLAANGWDKSVPAMADITAAAREGKIRLGITNPTRSNSGMSTYFASLYAFNDNPEVLEESHYRSGDAIEKIRSFWGSVNRTSESTGFLVDMYRDYEGVINAIFVYECLVIERNPQLQAAGLESLHITYPKDGVSIADSPLTYVDRGNAKEEEAFLKLQEWLHSPEMQRFARENGRRTSDMKLKPEMIDRSIFDPQIGVDTERAIVPFTLPPARIIENALVEFQTAFRKPSFRVYVLDSSGSMQDPVGPHDKRSRWQAVVDGMSLVLDPEKAKQFMLQPSARDINVIYAFSNGVKRIGAVEGNDREKLVGLLFKLRSHQPEGGTQMFGAAAAALQEFEGRRDALADYNATVVVLTDGEAQDNVNSFHSIRNGLGPWAQGIPVFGIRFGDISDRQLKELATAGHGRKFDANKGVERAFQTAAGY